MYIYTIIAPVLACVHDDRFSRVLHVHTMIAALFAGVHGDCVVAVHSL